MPAPRVTSTPMTQSTALRIRRAQPADAAAFVRIMGHPEVQANLMQLPYPGLAQWTARLAEGAALDKSDLQLVAELPDAHGDLQVVASAGLHPAGPALRRRHVMSLGISVAPEAQGQGVGQALMAALCNYADRWGQVLRIELSVFVDNPRAIALYQRHGFRQEGRHVGYALRDGAYVDALSMARLHPSPPRWDPAAPG